ncbi:intermembrane transport protein PqiB [Candidatus Steffania adelgidicola]|uniref:intermembrane transport protein PqiB n=1 Tax=Candidatus Steffania adelgidicola TaxID=1076626 RepID=UPI001D033545|nr:intermembrane transport protein PqiB [Candidatus Steffania adelgidicola]UDG79883.1 Paraquat-inducible protein B [Candidatus Steffania adelgidicola]
MTENTYQEARVEKIKQWSPVWIMPIITALIGAWILFYHFSHQGKVIILTTTSAEGLEAGKTAIKSRSVDIGIVESIKLSEDLNHVEIQARIHHGMEKILHKDSMFWIVKPQIGKQGISGLGTLLSGVYIQLKPGSSMKTSSKFKLLDTVPLAFSDTHGIRIQLDSNQSGQLTSGDPVLFRGFQVGTVETSHFDPLNRMMNYQLFINAPYDSLITKNVRFWKNSGIALNLSTTGMRLEMGALTTLFSGGVSFDVPSGWEQGALAKEQQHYQLFDNKNNIPDSLYTQHQDYVLFFESSIRGLQPGAPVEFRGIRLGTVVEVPFTMLSTNQEINSDYRIPILIRIEPDRFIKKIAKKFDLQKHLSGSDRQAFQASLKSSNLLTGLLYIDLDFQSQDKIWSRPSTIQGYPIIPTTNNAGLAQIEKKFIEALDKINDLPLDPMLNQISITLHELQSTLKAVNEIIESSSMQTLPQALQQSLKELNRTITGFQPGEPAYNKMVTDMQHLDQVLRTLNAKSNALVFEVNNGHDLQPKRAK